MAPTYSESGKLGSLAPHFSLPATDGKQYSLSDFQGAKALVVVFMCNHCPYVIAVLDRLNRLVKSTLPQGVQWVGINSNDAVKYPDDSFEAMKARAEEKQFAFPYLYDETQEVARAFGAVCTPEFYLYAPTSLGQWTLKYQGRLDDQWKDESAVQRQELAEAIGQVLKGKDPELDQKPAMGCSIKWK
jgi:peroxiredoxin